MDKLVCTEFFNVTQVVGVEAECCRASKCLFEIDMLGRKKRDSASKFGPRGFGFPTVDTRIAGHCKLLHNPAAIEPRSPQECSKVCQLLGFLRILHEAIEYVQVQNLVDKGHCAGTVVLLGAEPDTYTPGFVVDFVHSRNLEILFLLGFLVDTEGIDP